MWSIHMLYACWKDEGLESVLAMSSLLTLWELYGDHLRNSFLFPSVVQIPGQFTSNIYLKTIVLHIFQGQNVIQLWSVEWQSNRMTLFIIDVSYIFIFFFFPINSIFSINIHTESGQNKRWFRKWEDYLKKYTKSCSYPNWVIIQYYCPSLHSFRSVQKWNTLRSNCNKVFDFLFDRVKTYIF